MDELNMSIDNKDHEYSHCEVIMSTPGRIMSLL